MATVQASLGSLSSLHFYVHLYCNIFSFSYAVPLHSPFTLPLPQPFPSYRSTLSVIAFPILRLFYLTSPFHSLSLLTVPSFSASFTSHTNGHCFPISVLCTHIPPFHSSNQSFAVIHIAVAFLIYLPIWWRQQLPVDHLYTSSPHYVALCSTRWQFQNLSVHEYNRNCGVFSGWHLQHLV